MARLVGAGDDIAAVVLLVAVLGYGGATAAGWLGRVARFVWYRNRAGARARRALIPQPFSVDLPGVGTVGMRWDGQYAITMIALHGRA